MPNITKTFVRAAKCEEGKTKQEFYDDSLKGFVLEVRANGRKTFFLRHTTTDKKASLRLLPSLKYCIKLALHKTQQLCYNC